MGPSYENVFSRDHGDPIRRISQDWPNHSSRYNDSIRTHQVATQLTSSSNHQTTSDELPPIFFPENRSPVLAPCPKILVRRPIRNKPAITPEKEKKNLLYCSQTTIPSY